MMCLGQQPWTFQKQNEKEIRNDTGSEEEPAIILENIQSKSSEDSNDTKSLESCFAYCTGDYSESSGSIEALSEF